MKKSIKKVLTLLLCAVISMSAFTLFGCGGEDTGGVDTGKLSIQIYCNGSSEIQLAWASVIDAFEDATEDAGKPIKVQAIISPSANTQQSENWKSDTPPDLVFVDGNGLSDANLVKNGKFLDITEWYDTATVYGENTLIKDVINTSVIENFGDGKIYEIPVMNCSSGLYYDGGYVREKGYTLPKNYEELNAVCKKANSDNANIYGLTYPGKYPSYCLDALILPAMASELSENEFNDLLKGNEASVAVIRSAKFKEILQRWRDFCGIKGNLMAGSITQDHTNTQTAFLNNRSLFMCNGMWLEGEVKKSIPAEFEMRFINSPFIAADAKETVLIGAKNMAVASHGKHQDWAKEFISFLFRKDTQAKLVKGYGFLSALKNFDYTDSSLGLSETGKNVISTIISCENKVYRKYNWGTLGDMFNNVVNSLAGQEQTVDEAADYLVNYLTK